VKTIQTKQAHVQAPIMTANVVDLQCLAQNVTTLTVTFRPVCLMVGKRLISPSKINKRKVNDVNDYDRIADEIQEAILELCEGILPKDASDCSNSHVVLSDALISTISHLYRTKRWCKGLAEGHRMYSQQKESE